MLLVLTVAIGIATNVVTDEFTWAWGAALATLVLGAIAVQITASWLEGRDDPASAGSPTPQAPVVSGATVNIAGRDIAGRDIVKGVSGKHLSIIFASVAVVAASVFVIAIVVAGPGDQAGEAAAQPSSAGSANRALSAPDPYHYVAFEESRHLARKQTCAGLFGLCLGQPIHLATDAFGDTEVDGFPQSGMPGEMCHRWRPKRLDTVDVCEVSGAIRSVGYVSLSSTSIALAIPEDAVIGFPGELADQAGSITEAFRAEPFSSTYVIGDGESIFAMDWFLPQEAEGTPDTHLFLVARDPDFPKEGIRPCQGETEIYYPYREILKHGGAARVSGVEISITRPEDLTGPEVCR
ncbi:MAG: hypothetical protein ABW022_09855 [Actinoplanes sp.]